MRWPFRTKAPATQFALKHATFLYGVGAARWLERRFDQLAQEGYEKNPIVYACVTKLAKSVASVDLQLYRQGRGGKLTKLDDHPLLDLLARPNPLQKNGKKFIETLATQYLVGGNSYVLGVGPTQQAGLREPPAELWLLPPQAMKIEAQKRSLLPAWYEYKPAEGEPLRYPVDQITGRAQVMHVKTVNLMNPHMGLPPMVAAACGVDIFNEGQNWNKALLQNEGRPSGALQMRPDKNGNVTVLDETQFRRIREEIDTQYSGSGNAGRPLLLDSALEWVQMSMTAKDMDHRENMLTNARFIAAVYHTPPQLVNIPGESTYSNYGQAMLSYWADTVLPLLCAFLEDLNTWLTSLYGEDLYLWYDEEMIPALEPRRKEKADRIQNARYMTVNEQRRAMGLDDAKGGDVILVGYNTVPLELIDESVMLQNQLAEPGSEADEDEPEDGEEE